MPVTVSAQRSLNSSKGVISEPDLQYVPETELLYNLKNQGVTDVHRVTITKSNNKIPTKDITFTINSSELPDQYKQATLNAP